MNVEELKVSQTKAHELWQKYQSHRVHQTPADAEIAAIYKRIAQGKTVIRALESIKTAGLDDQGLPKLAIMRADVGICHCRKERGELRFQDKKWSRTQPALSKNISIPWEGMERDWDDYQAVVPLIPVHLRPRRGIQNYHILWEAEWTKRYPVDPYLLRRFGGDAWLVVAAWDLTDVECAVMTNRLRS